MIKIELHNLNINNALDIVRDLRYCGYSQGKDFDFAYFPEKISYDPSSGDFYSRILQTRRVEFYFENEQAAFLFRLKHGD